MSLCRGLPDGQLQYVMGPTGPMILIPSSNGHLAMPAIATPFQWLPQPQQQQPAQPMEVTVTTAASNNSVTMTTMGPKKTQPMFIAVTSTAQAQQQQQQQTTIDSFNEKHRDVEEHFKRSLALLHHSSSASSLPSSKDSTQVNANTVTITQATSTPSQPTLFMPTVQSTQITNTAAASLQQQITLANNAATHLKENVSEVGSHAANTEVVMSTQTKPQNVISNALNIENLIGTSSTASNPVTAHPTPAASQVTYEPSGHEQQQTKSADIQVATNPFPAIFLAPGGMYPQAAAVAAAGLNYAPFISMDPKLLGTMLVPSSQMAGSQAALLQRNQANEDMIKMVQAQMSPAVSAPGGTATENNDTSNPVMTMVLQQPGGVKPIYVVDNSDGGHQLRNISGSNIITMATSMDNGSTNTSNSSSTQNSSSQIVPTPMNTDDSSGQVMETNQPERRSVRTDISSVSEQVEDHFARALGGNWQLTQKY